MNPFVKIRLIRPEDHAAALAIYAPYITGTAISFEYEPPTAAQFSARISRISRSCPWLVAEADGLVAGYAYGSPHRERAAYRWSVECSVYVDPKYQRMGIASALYRKLLELLGLQGYVNVLAGLTLPNEKSLHFHTSMGFEPVGVYPRTGYKLGRWHDVLWMSLSLGPHLSDPPPPRPWTAMDASSLHRLLSSLP
jgi:phosphinothricin acetyltransferase